MIDHVALMYATGIMIILLLIPLWKLKRDLEKDIKRMEKMLEKLLKWTG